ncbi:MAG: helix-turn-helix domain-containing protein [Thermocrispum sp.]
MRDEDPVVAQIQLGILLRELRGNTDLTTTEAGRLIGASNATISRIENGKQATTSEHVSVLVEAYGASDAATAEALRLAAVPKPRARRRRSASYRDAAPNWFTRFLVMEFEASDISVYENEVITGLLQTEGYARSLLQAGAPLVGKAELDKKVQLRRGRQRILTRTTPPPVRLDVVLLEATLHRVIGSDQIMAEQLDHLLTVSELPNVDLRVLPFRPKPTPNHDESFVGTSRIMLLRLLDRGTLLYIDDFAGATYPEDLNVIQQYASAYQRLQSAAEDPASSAELIAKVATQYQ